MTALYRRHGDRSRRPTGRRVEKPRNCAANSCRAKIAIGEGETSGLDLKKIKRLGLGLAILLFALIGYGVMLLALAMLPETKGRSLDAIVPEGLAPLHPSAAE